jgi:tetratricopeptide (TPR) repeat protein
VVHVPGRDTLAEREQRVEQGDRVAAARDRDQHPGVAAHAVTAEEKRQLAMHALHVDRVRHARAPPSVAILNTNPRHAEDSDDARSLATRGERPLLNEFAEIERAGMALAREVGSDDPWIAGSLAGVALGLVLLAILLRRRRRGRAPARPVDPDVEIRKLVETGELERAADLLVERQQPARALPLYERAGAKAKLARALLLTKQPGRAAKVLTELGRHAEAAHHFQGAGLWREAGEALLLTGDERAAAELFERAGELERAAELHHRLGDAESASRLYARAGIGARAAETLLEARGRKPRWLKRAGELYESVSEWDQAATCYAEAGDPRQAAELFEKLGRHVQAAEAYEKAGVFERAANCHEKAGQRAEARACWERAGDRLRAAEIALEEGKYLAAARAFYEVGCYEHAIDALQRIPAPSADSPPGTRLLARIFLEKGLIDRAREKLSTLAEGDGYAKDDLDVLLMLATALERIGDAAGAVAALESISDVDAGYGDVEARLERLRENAFPAVTQPSVAMPSASDRYALRDEIGRGGMGIVYLASDRELERPVAIKFLPSELAANPEAVRMFRAEARAAASMNHPNIVHIYDVAVVNGQPCIVMEYVQGRTVREVMRIRGSNEKQPLPPRRVAEVGREMCRALAYAHRSNVIHRDVKPSNILLASDGSAKLMDFGISKALETGSESLTEAKGTPQYMPPEQILGHEIDGRTDLYALGISMFEMATAQRPFSGDGVVDQQLHAPLPDPRHLRPEIPEALVQILMKACQKDPDDRFSSAHEMGQALDAFLAGPGAA